jgi:hypothetical protein
MSSFSSGVPISFSGRESITGRGKNDHAHVFVGISGRERMIHLLDHQAGLRILVTRAIRDDFGDGAMLLVEDCLVFHP